MPLLVKNSSSRFDETASRKLISLYESIPQGTIEVDDSILPGHYCYLTSFPQKWTAFDSKKRAASMLHVMPDTFTRDDFSKVYKYCHFVCMYVYIYICHKNQFYLYV